MSSHREIHRVSILLLALLSLLFPYLAAWGQAPAPLPVPDRPLRLADCLAISEERQPSLLVGRARLAAAHSRLRALESINGPVARMRDDLPIRRKQAQLGIEAAQAELARIQADNRYVVTRGYLTVLFARAQRLVLDELIDDLRFLRERVQASVEKKERPEWTTATVDLITVYLRRAEARRTEADRGIALSIAVLREALNLDPTVCLAIADEPIPQLVVQVHREEIIAAAVAHRGEVAESSLASDAAALETDVQGTLCRRRAIHTFAAASDVHSKQVQQAIYGEDFRPGGIGLAMPDILVGPRQNRVETARDYSVQATGVAQKTRNLVILEAEEAYYNWLEWSQKVVLLGEAEKIGNRLSRDLKSEYRGALKRLIDALIPESVLAAQSRTDYNEALFRHAIALANIERVTQGAFCAGLATLPAPNHP